MSLDDCKQKKPRPFPNGDIQYKLIKELATCFKKRMKTGILFPPFTHSNIMGVRLKKRKDNQKVIIVASLIFPAISERKRLL